MKRFGAAALRAIDATKYFRLRSGPEHRYIAVWVVVVDGRVFVRPWNDRPTGWYRASRCAPGVPAVRSSTMPSTVRMP